MNAQDHPEYSHESNRLQQTIVALKALIESIGSSEPRGGDAHATQALFKHYRSKYRNLQGTLPAPYFGRIDFAPNDSDCPETYYIGKMGFSHTGQLVVDWQAPLARLFYEGGPGEVGYHSPDGEIKGLMLLKRNLGIKSQNLVTITDEFDLREPRIDVERSIIVDPDEYLREVLTSKQDPHLRDIVATIQAQQYELIRASAEQVLVIQGVAGSGKTSIALHRLAFLLYPGNAQNIDARRCIVFGPNQLFLSYVSNVLPDLGIENVLQTTLVDWACKQMDLKGYELTDKVLNVILSAGATRDQKIAQYRGSQLKNSFRMAQLLERYITHRRQQSSFPVEGLQYSEIGPLNVAVGLTTAEIMEVYELLAGLPYNQHRERLLDTLRGRLAGQYDTAVREKAKELSEPGRKLLDQADELRTRADYMDRLAQVALETDDASLKGQKVADLLEQGASGLREMAVYYQQQGEPIILRAASRRDEALEEKSRQRDLEQLARRLSNNFEHYWPGLNLIVDYYAFLADRPLLTKLSEGLFKSEEVGYIHQAEKPNRNIIDLSDLPAIHFLYTVANGVPVTPYEHIIIDEAQDVSRLQFETVRRFSRNGSLTVLGDLPQSIYAHRGISSWDEVKAAFPDFNYDYEEIKKSYRTTFEIITFANAVLRSIAQQRRSVILAEPFERHGKPPGLHPLKNAKDLPERVAGVVNNLQSEGYKNIAIVGKTGAHCSELASTLGSARLNQFEVALSPDFDYQGGVVLLPVHLAKGMEFEAVLLVGADDSTYTATEFDGRLLYVALTRALHILHVFWVGKVAYHLEQVVAKQTTKHSAR